MSAAAPPAGGARPAPADPQAIARRRALARLAAFAPLALVGLLGWTTLLAPQDRGAAWAMTVVATAAGAALVHAPSLRGRRVRGFALAGACALLLAGTLLAGGVDPRMLVPDRWDDLVAGIAAGVGSMAGITVPYRGSDEWLRIALMLGGTALTAIAVLQAFWPREPGRVPGSAFAAAFSLGTLYAVPVVEISPERPFLSGALFALLLGAFLFADRIGARQLVPAAMLLALATVAASALAPALDRESPWFDYEQFAEGVAARGTTTYAWNHSYGPLDWPRDGRELLRIKAQAPAYWKTEVLDAFDGRAWRADGSVASFEPDGEQDRGSPQWFQRIEVEFKALRSRQFVTAGSALRVFDAPRRPLAAPGGTFVTARGVLRSGSSYRAEVYTPRPTQGQLVSAGTDYPAMAREWLKIELPDESAPPGRTAGARTEIGFPPFASGQATIASYPGTGLNDYDGARVVRASSLGRAYGLAQRLAAASPTPYAFIRAVSRRVQRGASYTERPPRSADPLTTFLFDDRRGYCQHFSGAMALLLRMGGVPARVAVGFSPGRPVDDRRSEYSVTDFDAHSWVEAYIPRYGWVTFDPTPAAAPPREQTADEQAALNVRRGEGDDEGDRAGDRAAARDPGGTGGGTGGGDGGGTPLGLLAAGAALVAAAGAGGLLLLRRRRAAGPSSGDPDLDALERALRRSGRPAPPQATLAALRRRLADDPQADAYLGAIEARRYGTGGPRPSAAQRRGLRRALAAGLGRSGRLRAWWALPPRPF